MEPDQISNRPLKVGDLLQRTIGAAILSEIKDPRLQMANITSVHMSKDLRYADVYFSLLTDDAKPDQALQAFAKAKGFLRKIIAKQCQLRGVPDLRFHYDDTIKRASELDQLIAQAVRSRN